MTKLNLTNITWLIIAFCMITLTSCILTVTTHEFEMVPNMPIGTDSQFYYVKYGVIGTSSTSYTKYGGGDVRNGLVADAKANLRNQHLLGPNQAYSNMSVDVLETKAGVNTSSGFSTNSMTITVVVEADIIEYGTPPQKEYTTKAKTAGSLEEIENASVITTDSSNLNPESSVIILPSSVNFKLNDRVIFTDKEGVSYNATIIKLPYDISLESYKIEYINNNTITKKKWVFGKELRIK
jgi:hypothetical protein